MNEASPSLVGDYRQGGSFPPIPNYTEHSYSHCHQTAWCSSIPAHTHSVPGKPLLCSFVALFQGAECRQADKWQVPLWKLKTSLSQAISQSLRGKAGNKLPGQILSKDLPNPEENPICLTPLTNVAQTQVPAQEPPATT